MSLNSFRQFATGWDGTAYEVRDGWLGYWVDGVFHGVAGPDGKEATVADCRREYQSHDLQSFLNGRPDGLPPHLKWTTYPERA